MDEPGDRAEAARRFGMEDLDVRFAEIADAAHADDVARARELLAPLLAEEPRWASYVRVLGDRGYLRMPTSSSIETPAAGRRLRHAGASGDGTDELLVFDYAGDPKYQAILPGGGIEAGETVEETARREVLEETGLEVRVIREVGVLGESHFVQAAPLGPTADEWEHRASGRGSSGAAGSRFGPTSSSGANAVRSSARWSGSVSSPTSPASGRDA